jgi:hypothetical protein
LVREMESYKVLARVNAVFPTQEEMDRVGVEPTTSNCLG